MTNSKTTKRALISSVIALVLCFAMLLGTTFAWFTDTVTTGKNQIVAGNLDIELYAKDTSGGYVTVDENTNLFLENALWEPGHVEVINLKVANLGTLALKYQFSVNIVEEKGSVNVFGENFKLSDYIKFAVIHGEQTFATREDAVAAAEDADPALISALEVNNEDVLLPGASASHYVTLVAYMPTTVGNKANHKTGVEAPEITLGVNLVATQTPYESDSFDDQYDANIVFVKNETELKDIIENVSADEENINIVLPKTVDGEPITTNLSVPAGKTVTISGATGNPADTVLDGQIAALGNGTLYIKDVTINVDGNVNDSTNISQTGASGIAVWGDQDVICENVIFNMSLADSTAITAWWSTGDGANITVRNCTFNCNGQRPIRSDASVTVENCTFNDPYRYAVQMTSKASTITAEGNAVVNFFNNTINAGNISTKTVVYGVQLEGETYGCSNLTINGSGNTINLGDTGKTGTMYVYEGTTLIHDITWNVTDGDPVNIN